MERCKRGWCLEFRRTTNPIVGRIKALANVQGRDRKGSRSCRSTLRQVAQGDLAKRLTDAKDKAQTLAMICDTFSSNKCMQFIDARHHGANMTTAQINLSSEMAQREVSAGMPSNDMISRPPLSRQKFVSDMLRNVLGQAEAR